MQTRNFIIALIAVPLLLIIGSGIYFFGPWHKGSKSEVSMPQIPKALVNEAVISPTLSLDGQKVWYMTPFGKLYRVNIDTGEKEEYQLAEPPQSSIRVIWPKTGNDFIVEQGGGKGLNQFGIYNGAAKTFSYYPPQLQKAAFLSDVSKIVYEWSYADGRDELKVSDTNGANYRTVAQLRRPDYELVPSPAKSEAVLFGRDNLEPSYLLLVNLDTGEFKNIDEKDFYEQAQFSADGTKLLVTKSKKLMVYDLTTFESKDLGTVLSPGFEAAWGRDESHVIMGLPDGFAEYDLATGQKRDLYKFKEADNARPGELLVHPQKNLLFFVDQTSRQLYKLEY